MWQSLVECAATEMSEQRFCEGEIHRQNPKFIIDKTVN